MNKEYIQLGLTGIGSFLAARQYYTTDTNHKFQLLSEQINRSHDLLRADFTRQNDILRSELIRQNDILRQDLLLHMSTMQKETDKRFDRLEAKLN